MLSSAKFKIQYYDNQAHIAANNQIYVQSNGCWLQMTIYARSYVEELKRTKINLERQLKYLEVRSAFRILGFHNFAGFDDDDNDGDDRKDPTSTSLDVVESLIRKRYHRLSLRYHPDKGGDVEVFQKLKKAYETISQWVRRKHRQKQQRRCEEGGQPEKERYSMVQPWQRSLSESEDSVDEVIRNIGMTDGRGEQSIGFDGNTGDKAYRSTSESNFHCDESHKNYESNNDEREKREWGEEGRHGSDISASPHTVSNQPRPSPCVRQEARVWTDNGSSSGGGGGGDDDGALRVGRIDETNFTARRQIKTEERPMRGARFGGGGFFPMNGSKPYRTNDERCSRGDGTDDDMKMELPHSKCLSITVHRRQLVAMSNTARAAAKKAAALAHICIQWSKVG
jgi:curved DNA-binding protein CbpA